MNQFAMSCACEERFVPLVCGHMAVSGLIRLVEHVCVSKGGG